MNIGIASLPPEDQAWLTQAVGSGLVAGKSAFTQAFLTGRDLDGLTFGAAKLSKPYEQSAWVHRAIKLKVDEIARAPVKFYLGETELNDAAFLDWWKAPFIGLDGKPVSLVKARQQLASWPDLGGEFFILLGDDWLMPFRNWRAASKLLIARPERMRHIVQGGEIIGWVFTDGAGRQHALVPEQVIHRAQWNPYDDFRGLATVKAIMNAAESDYLAGTYVRNLMRANGDQGVYIIAKDGATLNDQQQEQIKSALREKRMRAQRGDFAAAFLTGDVTIEDAKAQAPGPEINNGRTLSKHEIFVGLGVPPSMSDVKAAYSLGADSDRFALITGGSMPLAAEVDSAITEIASRMYGKPVEAETDWDDHPVIQTVRRERLKSAIELFGVGMPIKDANAYLDLGMKPFPGWERGYLPFSVAPVSGDPSVPSNPSNRPATDPVEDPEFDEDSGDQDDDVKTLRGLLLARVRARQMECKRAAAEDASFAEFACHHAGRPTVQRAERPAREIAHWRTLMGKRRETINAFQSAIGRVLMQARVETLRKLDNSGFGKGTTPTRSMEDAMQGKSVATAVLFDLARFALDFKRATENQHKAALKTAGQQLFDEIDREGIFNYPPARAIEFLKARENKLRDVPQEMYDRVKAQLEEGLAKGETHAQLAGRVKTVFQDIADGAARTIALTETGAAYGDARQEAMQQAGIQAKAWLTSGNPNVRAAHEEAGLTYAADAGIPLDEPFIVDGEELMFPGDESGSPGNVINCHCVSIPVALPKE